MFEELIKKDDGITIDLKYDNKKYDIEYVKSKNMIILRRLIDNKILEIFSDKIGFIVQCDLKEQTNFLITDSFSTNLIHQLSGILFVTIISN